MCMVMIPFQYDNHYSDTVTRSGMFCATATVIDRCKTEGIVDVFQVVKALRVQKPGAVPTMVWINLCNTKWLVLYYFVGNLQECF